LSPALVAVVVCSPSVGPSTRVTEARPFDPVLAVAAETVPPPWAAHCTSTPGTGLPEASVTSTTRGSGSASPTVPICPFPSKASISVGSVGWTLSPQRKVLTASRPAIAQFWKCRSRVIVAKKRGAVRIPGPRQNELPVHCQTSGRCRSRAGIMSSETYLTIWKSLAYEPSTQLRCMGATGSLNPLPHSMPPRGSARSQRPNLTAVFRPTLARRDDRRRSGGRIRRLRRAGDRTRTGDVQLGKLAFYH
jgi:hypothetical protein